MSGTSNDNAAKGTGDPNEVAIVIGDTRLEGWKTVMISRSCESIPNSWALSASAQFLQGAMIDIAKPGQPCSIYIGQDLVITGKIDRRQIKTGPQEHTVTLVGRGLTRALVDCSAVLYSDADLAAGKYTNPALFAFGSPNTLELAKTLAKPFKIKVRSAVADLGFPIRPFQIALGETPYQIIESVARYAGYLVYEDEIGTLVLDRLGTNSMASGFSQPGNIEELMATQSIDQRYSDYFVVYYGVDQLSQTGPIGNQRAHRNDPTITEFRPLIRVSSQITPQFDVGEVMAAWELARRIGRSQAASLTCDKWRDTAGKLWTPNWLATVNAPDSDIDNAKWIIGSVVYRKDASGTHADLVLMPKEAFMPEPNPLNLWDAQIARQPPASQAPRPPSTTPPAATTPALGIPPT